MKISYLFNVRFPSERAHAAQITHMCQALAEAGHAVTLYTNARGEGTLESTAELFDITPRFVLTTLSPRHLYGDTKLAFAWREILFTAAYWWKFGNTPTDIIYSRDEWVLYLLSFLMPKARLVYESHEAKYNRAVRRLVKRGTKMVVISEGIRDYYKEQGERDEQLLVAHDAIDESFLKPPISQAEARERLELPRDAFIAMYIGGFDAWKGVETFFQAAELTTDVTFVAIGGKPAEVEQYRVQYPQVQFLGPSHYRDLHRFQQAADVLVIPNTADNELSATYTSPLKLFAHLASGVPIVASDVSSLRSVAGKAATYFVPDNAPALAEALIEIKQNYSSKQEQAQTIQQQASSWSWKARADAIEGFIREY